MQVSEMDTLILEHGVEFRNTLLNGTIKLNAVRRAEIPMDEGYNLELEKFFDTVYRTVCTVLEFCESCT